MQSFVSSKKFIHSGLDPRESSKQQGFIPSPPSAQSKKRCVQKSSEKKRPKENFVEVSDKEVVDTLVRLSTPLKSKNPRIIVKIPSSPSNPTKRSKTKSQLREYKDISTSNP